MSDVEKVTLARESAPPYEQGPNDNHSLPGPPAVVTHSPAPPNSLPIPPSQGQPPPPQNSQQANNPSTVSSNTYNIPPPQPSYNTDAPSAQPNNTTNPTAPSDWQQAAYQRQNKAVDSFVYGEKSVVEAYVLAISPLGILGAHHFYLRRYYWGLLYFFTLGLMGCGYVIDWFRVPCLVKESNAIAKRSKYGGIDQDRKTVSDAYTLWFPFGLVGFHHYYLGNYIWGLVYTFTLGLVGIGWLVDLFRIPSLVKASNERRSNPQPLREKSACATVALCLTPLGILGAHHYYLRRPIWGILYTFTLGLLGVGWIFDIMRLPLLIKRANKIIRGERHSDTKTVDDAYILWFPFGLVGFHHFYLGRPIWGVLYFFTLGIGGIGWLVDMVRIPFLVRDINRRNFGENASLTGTVVQGTPVPNYSTTEAGPVSSKEGAMSTENPAASPQQPYPPQQSYPPQQPYPPQQLPFQNYQQGAFGYGGPQQGQVQPGPFYNQGGLYPPVYGGFETLPSPSCPDPPPYTPRDTHQNNEDAGEMPKKN